MNSSPQHDYSAYLAEHDRIQSPRKPLGLEAYLLLREKLDELTLLELHEGMVQGMDKESLETLSLLTEILLEEGPACPPAPNGEEILEILWEREEMEHRKGADALDAREDPLDEDEKEAEPFIEEILTDLLDLPPQTSNPRIPDPLDRGFEQSFEGSLSQGRESPFPKGKAPDSKIRRELWRLKRRRGHE